MDSFDFDRLKDVPPIYGIIVVLVVVLFFWKNFMARALIVTFFAGYGFLKLYDWFAASYIPK